MVRLSPSLVLTLTALAVGCKTQPKPVELDYKLPPHPSQETDPEIPATDIGEPGNIELQRHFEALYYPDFGADGKFAGADLETLHRS